MGRAPSPSEGEDDWKQECRKVRLLTQWIAAWEEQGQTEGREVVKEPELVQGLRGWREDKVERRGAAGLGGGWGVSVGERECDTVTYEQKYVFGLRPYFCHRAPKTLGIS